MIENLIGKRYAEALSNAIDEESKLDAALEGLKNLREAFEVDGQLPRFFAHPTIPVENKKELVKTLCAKARVEDAVLNLLLLLVDRNKILYLKNIADYFEKVVDQRLNQVRVDVLAAHPLTRANTDQLKTSLGRVLGKTVLIDTRVDESLIGGVQLRVGDLVADATLRNRLALMKRMIEKEEVV